MQIDLIGRVRNTKLPTRQALFPLFEAVVNSIGAIEESDRKDGLITISVLRDLSQMPLDTQDNNHAPIVGFVIQDNGIGFTSDNFDSFNTMDSRAKINRGAKGIGRLLWLKAFDRAEIESNYQDDGNWRRRTFGFSLTSTGIDDHKDQQIISGPLEGTQTSIRLLGLLESYRDHTPRTTETIARRIIEHSLEYFLLGTAPRIIVNDPSDGSSVDLKKLFSQE